MHRISINVPKIEDTSSINYIFLLTKNYEQSADFLKQGCSNIEAVKGTMKLHDVFLHKEPNKIWIRNKFCFCKKCFNDSFMPESACKGQRVVNLRNLSNGFGSKGTIPEVDEYVPAVYDQNVYVAKTIEVDQSEAHVIFFQNSEKIEKNTLFRKLKKKTNSGYHLIKYPFRTR